MSDAPLSRRLRELLAQSERSVRAARETCALARRACDRARQAGANARAKAEAPAPAAFPSPPGPARLHSPA